MRTAMFNTLSLIAVIFAAVPLGATEAPIAHWPLDNSAVDVSGNNYDGIIYGAMPIIDRNCNDAGALYFDGVDDYIELFTIPFPVNSNTGSVTCWFKIDNLDISQQTIIAKSTFFTDIRFSMIQVLSDGSLAYWSKVPNYGGAYDVADNAGLKTAGGLIEPGLWYHVAVTADGLNTIKLYLNGQELLTTAINHSSGSRFFDYGETWVIGKLFRRTYNPGEHYFSGSLDDIRLYDRALDHTEIIAMANDTGCGPIPVSLDIKPSSCPNPLNVKLTQVNGDGGNVNSAVSKIAPGSVNNEAAIGGKGRAVLPVSILGTAEFDVAEINISSILLQGVAPIRWSFEDVSTPDPVEIDACACNTIGPDGYIDLTLKFDKDQIAATLSDIAVGDTMPLTITGQTKDGDAFEGTDCVVIVGNDNALVSTDSFESDASQMKFEGTVESPTLPIEFALIGNHPNPFNPATTIEFSLPKASDVSLEVYNIAGQKVATLVNNRLEAGYHSVTWDSRNTNGEPLASGIYLYRLKADTFVETKKMMLLK